VCPAQLFNQGLQAAIHGHVNGRAVQPHDFSAGQFWVIVEPEHVWTLGAVSQALKTKGVHAVADKPGPVLVVGADLAEQKSRRQLSTLLPETDLLGQ
jgi:hypothetical protein